MKFLSKILLLGVVLASVGCAKNKPNVVYILADDLGYADLSCYGQQKFKTPNIDAIAEKGILFTDHYAGSSVCAPSRSTLMTGQHTGHTPIRGNSAAGDTTKGERQEGQFPMAASVYTVAEMFQDAGYTTGAFGKWGLGYPSSEGDPTNQGFDQFYGYNCQALAHNYYPYHLWDNKTKVVLEGNVKDKTGQYAPTLIHDKAINFIKENSDKPFFMFYPSVIPHAELLIPEPELAQFRGKLLPEKEYKGGDYGHKNYKRGQYGSQEECHAAFAAMVTLLDKQVGEIVAELKNQGVYDNTIIIFTSDNGAHLEGGADPKYFKSSGKLRGFKRDLFEGGIRVPLVVSWNGVIEGGTVSNHQSAFWDFLPTVCDIIGTPTPDNVDGISFLPTLKGDDDDQEKHDYLYWEFSERGGRQAIVQGDWKLVKYNVFKKKKTLTFLFNLSDDISETKNLAESNPDKVKELEALLEEAHVESSDYTFDGR